MVQNSYTTVRDTLAITAVLLGTTSFSKLLLTFHCRLIWNKVQRLPNLFSLKLYTCETAVKHTVCI